MLLAFLSDAYDAKPMPNFSCSTRPTSVAVQGAAKPAATGRIKARPDPLQSGQKGANNKQSAAKAESDSDSNQEPAARSLLRARAGNASQIGRTQSQSSGAQVRPAAHPAASSDSDDDLLHAAQAKQTQLPASKLLSQSSSSLAGKSNRRGFDSALAQSRSKTGDAFLPQAIARTSSRDSSSSARAASQLLTTQASLQRSMASAGSKLATRQRAAEQGKAAGQSEADSDDDQWAHISVRAARPKSQLQVGPCKRPGPCLRMASDIARWYSQHVCICITYSSKIGCEWFTL